LFVSFIHLFLILILIIIIIIIIVFVFVFVLVFVFGFGITGQHGIFTEVNTYTDLYIEYTYCFYNMDTLNL